MTQLFMKQKILSLGGKFTIKNTEQEDVYFIEGSFMQVPKSFTIYDQSRTAVATITKKVFSFLPTFYVEVDGQERAVIKKEFSFLKPRYSIEIEGVEVRGNWLEMNFEIYQDSQVVGRVQKEWFTFADSYKIDVQKDNLEKLIVALVVAIDYVKASNNAAASAPPM